MFNSTLSSIHLYIYYYGFEYSFGISDVLIFWLGVSRKICDKYGDKKVTHNIWSYRIGHFKIISNFVYPYTKYYKDCVLKLLNGLKDLRVSITLNLKTGLHTAKKNSRSYIIHNSTVISKHVNITPGQDIYVARIACYWRWLTAILITSHAWSRLGPT